jgi:predicted transcriptional regulator
MSKTVTLRLNDDVYAKFRAFAASDNRSLSNFIETSALRYLAEAQYLDEFEMAEIDSNKELQAGLKQAFKDARNHNGNLISNV